MIWDLITFTRLQIIETIYFLCSHYFLNIIK